MQAHSTAPTLDRRVQVYQAANHRLRLHRAASRAGAPAQGAGYDGLGRLRSAVADLRIDTAELERAPLVVVRRLRLVHSVRQAEFSVVQAVRAQGAESAVAGTYRIEVRSAPLGWHGNRRQRHWLRIERRTRFGRRLVAPAFAYAEVDRSINDPSLPLLFDSDLFSGFDDLPNRS